MQHMLKLRFFCRQRVYNCTPIMIKNNVNYRYCGLSTRSQELVDRVSIIVRGGDGGNGCVSFARGPNQPVAPPDGGNGGDGGCVLLTAEDNCKSLRMSTHNFSAEQGKSGAKAKSRGRNGQDLIIKVPLGTIVSEIREDLNESNESREKVILCELNKNGEKIQVAQGGRGGCGNVSMKSSRNRSPTSFGEGEKGEVRRLELEMKLIADIGLVGFPNAGKSTLLSVISGAKPKIAEYPFTTIRPHVGRLLKDKNDDMNIIVADIPGIILGAHENRGLGHEFLKHVERSSMLLFVIDMSEGDESQLETLKEELELYHEGLSNRASCIVANKMDKCVEDLSKMNKLLEFAKKKRMQVFPVSAKYEYGTNQLIEYLRKVILKY